MQADELVLRDFLLESGILSRSRMAEVIEQAHDKPLTRALIESGVISEDELRRATAHALGITFVALAPQDIFIDALTLIPEPLSRAHSIVAYRRNESTLEVALLDMEDIAAIDFLKDKYNLHVRLTDRDSMKRALLIYQKYLKEKFGEAMSSADPKRAVDALLSHAALSRATALHVEPRRLANGGQEFLLRYRINGSLYETMRLHNTEALVARIKELANLSFTLHTPQEGMFNVVAGDEVFVVHVATLPTHTGEKITLGLARQSVRSGFTLESLAFTAANIERVHQLLKLSSGLIVVAGPHDSGKTTTLYTLLDLLSSPEVSVATVEKKVEHRLPNATQVEVHPEIGLSATAALRAVLKNDPDIVLVGDLDASEVALLALKAAARGLVVLAGVEADTTTEALEKIESFGLPPNLVEANINGMIFQRLLKKLCPFCSSSSFAEATTDKYTLSREDITALESGANFGRVLAALKKDEIVGPHLPWKEVQFYSPKGCKECEGGYQGLIGVQEILTPKGGSGLNLVEDALYKAAQGLTSIEEVTKLVS